ncbi:alpha-L-fucosidase [Marinilabilia rubra]|uniref:alpha-L-fucosidase n=1 Tax=Marinilabilia rubra TaxID=2162893 RepID=A0A2U2B770_9BACT|nr:alpha-L-fucosidase [Marinilabilia rubra]PWD98884.1 alpha-1,3/4-fucosidase [Marinilabilia rubra]
MKSGINLIKSVCLIVLAFFLFLSCNQTSEQYFTQSVEIPPNASKEEIVELSTRVLPHSRQVKWFNDEFFGFIHYGPNTYTGREWGTGDEDAALFNPGDLDTDQWCRLMKEAGMKRVIMVVKHHDGYCLWQTRYTNHSVASSPWKSGEGDVLRELVQSAEKYGLRVGVYLSPADLYQIESEEGYYGNGSKFTERTIPRNVEDRPFEDQRSFTCQVDDYNEYFLNQLFELLTEYGPIYEVWFDGANPKPGTGQTYNYEAWFDLIRTLAPDAVIFGKGPDARWCGNEAGATREAEYNVVPLPVSPSEFDWPDMTDENIAGRENITEDTEYFHYLPVETNTSIRHGWFWRNDDEQQVRSADDVFDIYERSVGGNSIFLLNIPPNPKGQFSSRDAKVLKDVGRKISEVYGAQIPFEKKSMNGRVTDQNASTWWSPSYENDALEIQLDEEVSVNRFVVREAIARRGERVEKHILEARLDGEWVQVAEGQTIGHKRILRFPAVITDALRLIISKSRATPCISEVSVHYYDEPPKPVVIRKNKDGKIELGVGTSFSWKNHGETDLSQPIYYTLDGSEPTVSSIRYEKPFALPSGGYLKAKAIVGEQGGAVNEQYIGMSADDFAIKAPAIEGQDPQVVIDGNYYSSWVYEGGAAWLTIELGQPKEIGGFKYVPANRDGAYIESYKVEISNDGKVWKTIKEARFGNIVNDPSPRVVLFDTKVETAYIRFSALKGPGQRQKTGIAELEILPPLD